MTTAGTEARRNPRHRPTSLIGKERRVKELRIPRVSPASSSSFVPTPDNPTPWKGSVPKPGKVISLVFPRKTNRGWEQVVDGVTYRVDPAGIIQPDHHGTEHNRQFLTFKCEILKDITPTGEPAKTFLVRIREAG